LLTCIWWVGYFVRDPSPNDLSAGFLAITNNPGSSVYPRLSVVGDGRGLYALFAVTNISQGHYIRFGLAAIETQVKERWRADKSGDLGEELGSVWSPGYSSVYAFLWPANRAIDTPWRLRLWVMREPKLVFISINQRLGREVFRAYGHHTVTSDVVAPMMLHNMGPSAYVDNAHERAANRSQPICSQTNRTSSAAGSGR